MSTAAGSDLTVVSWADLKSRFWICPLCKLCTRIPKVLPCLHSFCQDCLENHLLQNHAGRFQCPVCKTLSILPQRGVEGFASNVYIEKLQESRRRIVDKYADRSIESCICHLCSEFREFRTKVKEKERIKLDARLAQEKSDAEKSSVHIGLELLEDCHFHAGETVLYFCVDCQQPACRICIEVRHRDHRFEPMALAAENAKSLLKTTQEVLNVRRQSNSKFLKKLEYYSNDLQTQREKSLADVDTCIKHMHDILDKVKERLVGDIDRLFNAENGAIVKLTEELELSQQQLEGVSGFLDAHQDHDPSELVQQRYLITDRINQLFAAEHKSNFPMNISFQPAIPGMSKDDSWLYRAEVAMKNSVGSIVSGRSLAADFLRGQTAARGEVNKAVLLATYSLTISPQSDHEIILLAEKATNRRQSLNSRPNISAPSTANSEIPLTRHSLPSLAIDSFGYIFVLDRSSGTVARYFGGCDIAKRVYCFPLDRCRPLRLCSVGSTGGFAYVDAFSPAPTTLAFSLRFVPRTGDRFDLILPLDRSLFLGSEQPPALPDKIPAICADQNSNIYILDVDGDGKSVIIAYSMSFGSVRRIVLESGRGVHDNIVSGIQTVKTPGRRFSVIQPPTVNARRASNLSDTLEVEERPDSETPQTPFENSKGTISADFGSYIACCPHCTGTREILQSTSTNACSGVFAVVDTLRDSVRMYDIYGAMICELNVPSPLDKISHPRGVAFDHQGNLIVCDYGNNRLLLFDHTGRRLRGILAAGPPALEALRHPVDVIGVPGRFQCYVAEETTSVVKIFDYSSLVAPHSSMPGK